MRHNYMITKILNMTLRDILPSGRILTTILPWILVLMLSASIISNPFSCFNPVDVIPGKIEMVGEFFDWTGGKIQFIDSEGNIDRVRITPRDGFTPELAITIEDSTDMPLQAVISRNNSQLFPDFNPNPLYAIDIIDNGQTRRVTSTVQRPPFLDFMIKPTLGFSTNFRDPNVSLGANVLKVGPLYVGPNLNTGLDSLSVTPGVHASIRIQEHLMIGPQYNTDGSVRVALTYMF